MPTDPALSAQVPAALRDVADAVHGARGWARRALESLVRIPSVSVDRGHVADCRASAEATADLLREAGLESVELLELPVDADGEVVHPYVTGELPAADPDAPTVLLYAHHDVQPVGTPERWHTDPFTPTERDGRLYGRGAADDKAGIVAHVVAATAWREARGGPPVHVKVIIEGEEEIGSPNLERFLEVHGDRLRADVIVLADLVNWQVGWPSLTYALRGMAGVDVTVRTLQQPVHSGMWGGAVPDALTASVRLLATLHDDAGAIAVAGFTDDVRPRSEEELAALAALGADPDALRRDVRMREGVDFVGDPAHGLLERLWFEPTITPIGTDAPDLAHASNTLLSEVTTRLSVRFAPGQDPQRALAVLTDHLEAHVPFGAQVQVRVGEHNAAWVTEPQGPAWDAAVAAMTAAYGRAPATVGCGGSIPFVQPFAHRFDGVPCLLVGVEDPASNAHGEDESLHLADFERACLAEALLLAELADRLPRR